MSCSKAVLLACALLAPSCGGQVYLDPPAPLAGTDDLAGSMAPLSLAAFTQLDLLFVVDNSRSMADKQDILAASIDGLVRGLVSPPCVDASGATVSEPPDPLASCPPGSNRRFSPLTDIHIGVVTSSLGGVLNACATDPGEESPTNDRGRLVARALEPPFKAPTYLEKGFLAWDPLQTLSPPGEGDLETDGPDPDGQALLPVFVDMVRGAGQQGCGFESLLESAYRFLVDPSPYAELELQGSTVVPLGLDDTLLAQRAAFLRPSSLLAVVLLSDENDCSFRMDGQFWIGGRTDGGYHLPPPRSECASNPSDPCCLSCGQAQGACPPDPACAVGVLPAGDDHPNLRCFDQKRRFGVDFLHPVARYAEGFTSTQIASPDGSLVENPLFAGGRPPGGALFLGIVGVPWQDIARDPFDLGAGFLRPAELGAPGATGQSAWDLVLGNPAQGVLASDPLMRESVEIRSGSNPATGELLASPGDFQGNSINGNEYSIPNKDDLQYACTFPLPVPRDCTDLANNQGCDCPTVNSADDQTDKPVCSPDAAQDHLQTHAKAYPGRRTLELLRSLGPQGMVGSICSGPLDDPGAPDFGYRPSVELLLGEAGSRVEGRCLESGLAVVDGVAQCALLRVSAVDGCTCDAAGLQAPTEAQLAAVAAAGAAGACVCVVKQLTGEALGSCQAGQAPAATGWCYVDTSASPPLGSADLVSSCPASRKRTVVLTGGADEPHASYLLGCGP